MTEPIDWTDETLRSLEELARLAFPPSAGVTPGTLKRRARQGKLVVYRPGKFYMSSFVGIRAMLEATRVEPKPTCPEVAAVRKPPGASETESAKSVQERLLAKLAIRQPPKRRRSAP